MNGSHNTDSLDYFRRKAHFGGDGTGESGNTMLMSGGIWVPHFHSQSHGLDDSIKGFIEFIVARLQRFCGPFFFRDVLIQHLESMFAIPQNFPPTNHKPTDFTSFTNDIYFIIWRYLLTHLSFPDPL